MSRPILLAVSHGTSDPDGAAAIQGLVDRVAARLSGVDVRLGFVDVQHPDATAAVAAAEGPTVVVPLLLSQGFHVRVDLARAVAGRSDVVATGPLGPDRRLAHILASRLDALQGPPHGPVVLAVAGSRHPSSVPDATAQADLLAQHTGREVITAYVLARSPSLVDVLQQHPEAPVATYLLARGFFFDLARRQAGKQLITDPLLDGRAGGSGLSSTPPVGLVGLVIDRYTEGAARLVREASHRM